MNYLVIVLMLIGTTHCLIGYDCNGNYLNVTTISLNSIGDCNVQPVNTEYQETSIQLLQLSEFEFTSVRQCKVQITRIVHYCGMHSHVDSTQRTRRVSSRDNCPTVHKDASRWNILPWTRKSYSRLTG
jgi:hypothetical protein